MKDADMHLDKRRSLTQVGDERVIHDPNAAELRGAGARAGQDVALLDLVTTRDADVLGHDGCRLTVGNRVDLIVHEQGRLVDVLRMHARRWVMNRRRVVASTTSRTSFDLPRCRLPNE